MTPTNPALAADSPGRILLGMSGGVDSSVAAFLLRQQGWEVIGLTLLTHDGGRETAEDASSVCRQLGLEWHLADVREKFAQIVIKDFIEGYLAGRTPNPCIICNPAIKFVTLYEEAERLSCSAVATGHYAAISRNPENGRLALMKTESGLKDQTYFMYRLNQDQLSRLIFPLSGLDKASVRQIAAQAGLLGSKGSKIAEKPDSQDNCFIPNGNYAEYIEKSLTNSTYAAGIKQINPGPVINMSGQQIGTHQGLIHYTFGQRKGFQVQTTERLFVVGKIPATNSLIVGLHDQVMRSQIRVREMVFSGLAALNPGERLEARIRNSAREVPCTVFPEGENQCRVEFDQPVSAPAPGQSCVFYRNSLIMAGGFIAEESAMSPD